HSFCSSALFLHYDLPLRYLRSFPTRRSSDLQDMADAAFLIRHDRLTITQVEAAFAAVIIPDLVELRDAFERAKASRSSTRSGMIDRKSTRLNSSHVSISYAVFCLKKKKKTSK